VSLTGAFEAEAEADCWSSDVDVPLSDGVPSMSAGRFFAKSSLSRFQLMVPPRNSVVSVISSQASFEAFLDFGSGLLDDSKGARQLGV
jgi:hypothetical protein